MTKIIKNIKLDEEQEEKIYKFYHQIEPKFNRNNKPNKVKFYMDFIKIIQPPDYLVIELIKQLQSQSFKKAHRYVNDYLKQKLYLGYIERTFKYSYKKLEHTFYYDKNKYLRYN
jgi:hypothetical protein